MKTVLTLFCLFAMTSCRNGTAKPLPAAAGRSATVPALQTNDFAFKLYDQLRTTEGTLFFSPASIEAALSMTAEGAHGHTQKQFFQTLENSGRQECLPYAVFPNIGTDCVGAQIFHPRCEI